MEHSEKLDQIATALARAQGEYTPVVRNKKAEYDTSKGKMSYSYAELSGSLEMALPILSRNGLALTQPPATTTEEPKVLKVQDKDRVVIFHHIEIETWLIHSSGQYFKSSITWTVGDTTDLRELGLRITYLRRFAANAMLGIAPEDDMDAGEGESGIQEPQAMTGMLEDPTKSSADELLQAGLSLLDTSFVNGEVITPLYKETEKEERRKAFTAAKGNSDKLLAFYRNAKAEVTERMQKAKDAARIAASEPQEGKQ